MYITKSDHGFNIHDCVENKTFLTVEKNEIFLADWRIFKVFDKYKEILESTEKKVLSICGGDERSMEYVVAMSQLMFDFNYMEISFVAEEHFLKALRETIREFDGEPLLVSEQRYEETYKRLYGSMGFWLTEMMAPISSKHKGKRLFLMNDGLPAWESSVRLHITKSVYAEQYLGKLEKFAKPFSELGFEKFFGSVGFFNMFFDDTFLEENKEEISDELYGVIDTLHSEDISDNLDRLSKGHKPEKQESKWSRQELPSASENKQEAKQFISILKNFVDFSEVVHWNDEFFHGSNEVFPKNFDDLYLVNVKRGHVVKADIGSFEKYEDYFLRNKELLGANDALVFIQEVDARGAEEEGVLVNVVFYDKKWPLVEPSSAFADHLSKSIAFQELISRIGR